MTTSQEKSLEKSVSEESYDLSEAKPAELAWRSTWLDQRAYHAVNIDPDPLKRGLFPLLIAVAVTAVARLIGIGLGILTSPKIGIIQDQVYEAITGTAYFGTLVEQTPDFLQQFEAFYLTLWDIIRLVGGYPSYAGLGSSLINLLFTLGSWLVFALLTYLVAAWFGARTDVGRALGVFALAYTPIMLTLVEVIPGGHVAWSLIFMLILVAKFLAAREVYKLGPGSSLAVILLPYLIGMIIIFNLLIFGAALGLNQIPYLDELLRTLRFAGLVTGS